MIAVKKVGILPRVWSCFQIRRSSFMYFLPFVWITYLHLCVLSQNSFSFSIDWFFRYFCRYSFLFRTAFWHSLLYYFFVWFLYSLNDIFVTPTIVIFITFHLSFEWCLSACFNLSSSVSSLIFFRFPLSSLSFSLLKYLYSAFSYQKMVRNVVYLFVTSYIRNTLSESFVNKHMVNLVIDVSVRWFPCIPVFVNTLMRK